MKRIKNLLTIIALMMMELLSVKAQEPELVKDINELIPYYVAFTHQMKAVNGKIFFTYNLDNYDLGVYNGESFELFHLNTGGGGQPANFTAVGNRVYFTATNSTAGTELWMYQNGEVTEIDINEGPNSSSPSHLTAFNASLYFQADDGISGKELWSHDGTTATLFDINEGSSDSNAGWMTIYNNKLIFYADNGEIGYEPHIYDGLEVAVLSDIRSGVNGSSGTNAAFNPYYEIHDGALYFAAHNGIGIQLFEYDGTDLTFHNISIYNGLSPKYMTSFNSKLYLYAVIDDVAGQELIEFDGSTARVVEDIYPGTTASNINPETQDLKFGIAGGNLFFRARDDINSYDLYKFDGTTVTRIPTNTDNSDQSGNSHIDHLGVVDDKIYFQAYGGSDKGTELWEHDGTNLKEISIRSGEESSSVRWCTDYNGDAYFTAHQGDGTSGWALWKYNGTTASPIPVDKTVGSSPYEFAELNDKIYFTADDGINGRELWSSDGTTTELVADLYPGEDGTEPYVTRAIGSKLFFFGYTEGDDMLYVYDGTDFETFTFSGEDDGAFIEYDGDVFFQGWSSEFGSELYKYDESGVTLVQDIKEGSSSSNPKNFFIWNSELYFSAGDDVNGTELWKYDGTEVSLVSDVNSEASSSSPRDFVAVGTDLYFRASSSATGTEIVKYDGTNVTFFDINDGTAHSYPSNLTEYNGKLVCVANDDLYLEELVVIDGTTIEVIDINTSGNSYPQDLFVYKDKLYLSAYTETEGRELYVYDGTDVTMIDLLPGTESSFAQSFFEFGPYMYFSANSGSNPYGIHRYDAVGEIEFLGPVGASFEEDYGETNFAILDNYAYFKGEDESLDTELYRIRRIEVGNDILTFSLADQTNEATIDTENHTISIETLFGTDLSSLNPTITISDYAEIDLSGAQDFTSPVVYTVTSEYGETQQWTVTVTEAENSSPVVDNDLVDLEEIAGFGSASVSYNGVFSDPETQSLTVEVESSNENVVTAEVIVGEKIQINEVGLGVSTITVTASDGFGGSVSDEFTFTVTEAPNNAPIVANPITDKSMEEGFESTTIDLTDVFTDQDGDTMTYSASSSNTSIATVAVTNATLTITEVGTGSTTITVTASDGNEESVSDEFTFTVTEAPLGLAKSVNIKVYPNPFTDFINIDANKSLVVQLVDLNGRILQTIGGQDIKMDLKAIESGIYLLKINDGKSAESKRIIKAN